MRQIGRITHNLAVALLLIAQNYSEAFQNTRLVRTSRTSTDVYSILDGFSTKDPNQQNNSRRDLLNSGVKSVASMGLLGLTTKSALAADSTGTTASDILLKMRSIPTFSIVNGEGVPFMIFDGQASATGYFFLSFSVAMQTLQDARQKDQNTGATEVWSGARIIVAPLAVALQLTLRKTQREAVNNGIKFNTYNDIVPSQEGVDGAKAVEESRRGGNPAKWEQKGRVPLFYIEGLTLADGREPRYFNQGDLRNEWETQHPQGPLPGIEIVEMVDLYRQALSKNDLSKIANLAIMPVKETNQVASKLLKASDGPPPSYNFSKVYLVGSASG